MIISLALAGPPPGARVVLPADVRLSDPTGNQSISFVRPVAAEVVDPSGRLVRVRAIHRARAPSVRRFSIRSWRLTRTSSARSSPNR